MALTFAGKQATRARRCRSSQPKPNLVIVDIGLPDGNGIELPEKIRAEFPKLRVLTLFMHEEPLYCRALRTGAQGYVVKREAIGKIVDALREILNSSVTSVG
jgi:two-component system, NarL family, response regulator FusR